MVNKEAMKLAWFEQLSAIPPKRLRLFAFKGTNFNRRLKTRKDIARDSGLAESTVSRITYLSSWDSLSFKTMLAYIRGCGIDPLNLKARRRYLRRANCKKTYLNKLNASQRRMMLRATA